MSKVAERFVVGAVLVVVVAIALCLYRIIFAVILLVLGWCLMFGLSIVVIMGPPYLTVYIWEVMNLRRAFNFLGPNFRPMAGFTLLVCMYVLIIFIAYHVAQFIPIGNTGDDEDIQGRMVGGR